MNNLKLAVRNLLRNRRRSVTTILTMVIGMTALLLFGGFISSIYFGMQTEIVRSQGHLHIYPQGYLEYGSSRSTDYYIDDYKALINTINSDDFLKNSIEVITPIVHLNGIAGNYAADTSKTFFATGLIPSEHNKMQLWDNHKLNVKPLYLALTDDNTAQGVVGFGMARMLNLCESLNIADCSDHPSQFLNDGAIDDDVVFLQSLVEDEIAESQADKSAPHIDLLASTASGAPNAVSLSIVKAQRQGNKILDDSFIAMHLQQAQQLVFSNDSRVTTIVLQLKNSELMEEIQVYLEHFLDKGGSASGKLEVKNFTQFNAEFYQVMNMFFVIFIFVALVISLVVLFTTINTLTMSVMERVSEIGSLRAMGLRRSAVRWQFLLEGMVIGVVGATLGIIVAIGLAQLFNQAGFSWIAPGSAERRNLQVLLFSTPYLMFGTWFFMIFVATLSSLMPARFAAKMNIVDAIRNS